MTIQFLKVTVRTTRTQQMERTMLKAELEITNNNKEVLETQTTLVEDSVIPVLVTMVVKTTTKALTMAVKTTTQALIMPVKTTKVSITMAVKITTKVLVITTPKVSITMPVKTIKDSVIITIKDLVTTIKDSRIMVVKTTKVSVIITIKDSTTPAKTIKALVITIKDLVIITADGDNNNNKEVALKGGEAVMHLPQHLRTTLHSEMLLQIIWAAFQIKETVLTNKVANKIIQLVILYLDNQVLLDLKHKRQTMHNKWLVQ
mmetsp:Transcript_14029/g.15502  ORF Transcript_14029/g.15502 Transcript_14029/m.15502 type:complete len:260 (+) Transcript_14029:606-1385(+)